MAKEPTDFGTLPQQSVDRLVQPLARFLHVEAASGVTLRSSNGGAQ